jgi:hypothetical protein
MDIVKEFENVATGLVAAIKTMTGAKRRSAEARLSRTIESIIADHAEDVLFVHSKEVTAPEVIGYMELR